MGEKLTVKQEAFALAYVELGSATQAYRRAYDVKNATDKSVNELASHALAHVKIASRIAELRAKVAEKHEITLDKLTDMNLEAYKRAKSDKDSPPSTSAVAMVAAIRQLSKMHGFDTEKRENDRDPLADLPADVRRDLVARLAAVAAASGDDREESAIH